MVLAESGVLVRRSMWTTCAKGMFVEFVTAISQVLKSFAR